jgi:RNA polymerase sigma-70 factor (ECF subfamily)
VSRIVSGDKHAEQELVTHYFRSLVFILKRQTQDYDLVQDIAQDTFITVITKIRANELTNADALSRFIRQIGLNLLIAHFRKETRRKTDSSDDIDLNFNEHKHSEDIAFHINAAQIDKLVKQTIDELPTQRDRDLLIQYFIYGQSKQQLCDSFDMKPEHFDRVLYRARQRLKQLLQIKLNLDLNTQSVSHLLSILIVLNALVYTNTPSAFFQLSSFQLREQSTCYHSSHQDVIGRCLNEQSRSSNKRALT